MASWSELERVAPELATAVRRRFEAHGLALVATLRKDGSPRISGIETVFALGELWLGMMPGSRKAADLLRDPRFALHAATTDKQVTEGDAKLSGRAVVVEDADTFRALAEASGEQSGDPPAPGSYHLFKLDVTEVSTLQPEGDHLNIDWWREGGQVQRIERR